MKQGVIKKKQRLEGKGGFGRTMKIPLRRVFSKRVEEKTDIFQNGRENKSWE